MEKARRISSQNKLLLRVVSFLLKKSFSEQEIIRKLQEKVKEIDDENHIRCPHCNWKPEKSSLWCCSDCDFPENFHQSCGTAWNTFDTAGKCPGCHHQWRWTLCLSCHQWSLHKDWYTKEFQ